MYLPYGVLLFSSMVLCGMAIWCRCKCMYLSSCAFRNQASIINILCLINHDFVISDRFVSKQRYVIGMVCMTQEACLEGGT